MLSATARTLKTSRLVGRFPVAAAASPFRHRGSYRQPSFAHRGPHHRPTLYRARLSTGLPHDVGGDKSAFGSLILSPDELQDWEVRCHSLFAVLAVKGAASTDGLRRSIESLTPRQYSSWLYYEKWAAAMATLLLESEIITSEELNGALFGTQIDNNISSGEPVYKTGDFVRVRSYRQDDGSEIEWRRPHVRVPGYIYGVRGVIERVCGEHKDPSFLAFGLNAPSVRLYRVRFRMKDVWPENHDGKSNDAIEVEVYEPWLERSTESTGHDFDRCSTFLVDYSLDGSNCASKTGETNFRREHDHNHHDHSRDLRPLVEERAATLEGGPRPGKELFSALMKVLIGKDIITPDEVREMSEKLVMAGKTLNGARLVAKAWADEAFEKRLLKDAPAAAAELDIVTTNPNSPTVLTVVQNTEGVHNLVVCTLCSCYPSGLLGIAPSWYKSREYRSRAVREPRQVLLEFGTIIPKSTIIRVHDSTADHRYIVLPKRPEGTEKWTEEQLKDLATRDSMVGVSLPRVPTT